MSLRGFYGQIEYLSKDEAQGAPRTGDRSNPCESFTHVRGDFTFGGHRLSSLYREYAYRATRLTTRYRCFSSLYKYSTPARTEAQASKDMA